jgi:hypothetical protein
MVILLIAAAAAAAAPSPEALRLGRELAESGTLATLLPLIQHKETEELVAAHPELKMAEKDALRATAERVYKSGRERLMQSEARGFAEQLSIADLRAIASFQRSTAAKRYRAATPVVIATMMKSIGQMDFKGDVLAAYCRQTGKLCAR